MPPVAPRLKFALAGDDLEVAASWAVSQYCAIGGRENHSCSVKIRGVEIGPSPSLLSMGSLAGSGRSSLCLWLTSGKFATSGRKRLRNYGTLQWACGGV